MTLGSPLASPRLTAQLRNNIPTTQLRRWWPWAAAFVAVFMLIRAYAPPLEGHAPPSNSLQAVQNVMIHPPSLPYNPSVSTYPRERPQTLRTDFPPKIWQFWKVDPLRFETRDLEKARSWTEKNPDWRYEVLTDGNDMRYIEYHYGPEGFNRPDIVSFYRDVQAAIIKADVLRYLVMYAEGGVYADIDVEAMKPMSKFIPERYDRKEIDMVVGVEIDEPEWRDHPILGPKSRSFCQWTFMCKPQLPVMLRLVENIMGWLTDEARNQSVPLGEVVLDFDEVISGTGPSAFTNAIIAQMNQDRILRDDQEGRQTPEITWDAFHDLDESKVVERVLVLNVEAFAAGQGHSNSGTHDTRHSLVRHHYHASNWPSRHPRYKHPAYGQVEDCNWDKECVHRWDNDVAAFKTLPEPEQERIIAEKQREREEKEAEEKRKKEEEEAREREEDEKRKKEDEEKARAEEEAKRAREEEEERAQNTANPEDKMVEAKQRENEGGQGSSFWASVFGYSVFLGVIAFIVISAGCTSKRQFRAPVYTADLKV